MVSIDGGDRFQVNTIQRQRVQLDFTLEAYKRLKEIQELAGARTSAEVIRNALRVYEWFLNEKRAKSRIQVIQSDNKVKEVEILL